MYLTIREYQTDPKSIDEIKRQVETNFVPLISNAPGFRDYYFIDSGNGTFASVSLFANRSDGEQFNTVAMNWVREHIGSLAPTAPKVVRGEVSTHATGKVLAS
jgi:ribosomal protein L11 methylase PrmA